MKKKIDYLHIVVICSSTYKIHEVVYTNLVSSEHYAIILYTRTHTSPLAGIIV